MDEASVKMIILWVFYLIYMVLGAVIFMELESENEKTLVKEFKQAFEEFNLTSNLSTNLMNDLSSVYSKACSMGIDPYTVEYQNKWDFAGSFYFVGTVLTTIGFGLTAPITFNGQMCFLIYSLFGIPLNILLFNTLLDKIVHLLSSILGRFYRLWKTTSKSPRTDGSAFWEPSTLTLALTCLFTVTLLILAFTPLFVYLEDWSFFESVYFAVVAFTTVGFGDFVPSGVHTGSGQNLSPHYKVGNLFVLLVGTVVMYTATALLASVYKQSLEYLIQRFQKRFRSRKASCSAVSPETCSTPAASALNPFRDEKNRIIAQKVLQNWRAVKKVSIGQVNTVEASIMKSRMTNNDDQVTSVDLLDAFLSTLLPGDNNEVMSSKINQLTNLEDLTKIETRLTNGFNRLMRDIQERKETVSATEKITESVEIGIETGMAISLSPLRSSNFSPFSPNSENYPCEILPEEDDSDRVLV